jgi:hypothetical protein
MNAREEDLWITIDQIWWLANGLYYGKAMKEACATLSTIEEGWHEQQHLRQPI